MIAPDTTQARAAFAKWWMDARGIEPEFRTEFGFNQPGRMPRLAVRCTDCDYAECTGWRMTIPDDDPNPTSETAPR